MTPPSSPSLTPFGRRALVTGASRGIGFGVAEVLASHGCDVIVNDIGDVEKMQSACDGIASRFGVQSRPLGADVGHPTAARAMVNEAARLLGGLDIVVCNAGICDFKPFLEISDADWLRHVDTNFNGSFYVAQEAARIMVAQGGGGRIIFTSSVGAFRSNGTQTHYCATKGGLHLLMQGMALELGPYGITVNAVAPGWIHTDINDGASRDPAITGPWIKAHAPVGRLGSVEDLKSSYLLLASRESAYVNGSTITVDGGWLAQL